MQKQSADKNKIKNRLEYLRHELRNGCISYSELAGLHDLRDYIEAGDVELLEAAGVPEFHSQCEPDNKCRECLGK